MRWFITCCVALASLLVATAPAAAQETGAIVGTVTDRHSGAPVAGVCAVAYAADGPGVVAAEAVTDETGRYAAAVPPGSYRVAFFDCAGWDYAGAWHGAPVEVAPGAASEAPAALATRDLPGLVDVGSGRWYLAAARAEQVVSFFYGNPGDVPMVGDWDCDGVDTPGLYRQSDGYVYLRNSNTQGVADVRFYFGDPGDVPLAGDFDGDGCDTVSLYRPATSQFFVINELGSGDAGLGAADTSFTFGAPGDRPFAGDFDGDGVDSVGMHRPSTGWVYLRNEPSRGPADREFRLGDPGDAVVAGDFAGLGTDAPAIWRPGERTFHLIEANGAGRTDAWPFAAPGWAPVAGRFGL